MLETLARTVLCIVGHVKHLGDFGDEFISLSRFAHLSRRRRGRRGTFEVADAGNTDRNGTVEMAYTSDFCRGLWFT